MSLAIPSGAAETATPVEEFTLLPGFKVELLYSVPREEQGSWVNMTVDPKGRLIVSDQNGLLYRVTPPPIGESNPERLKIEPIQVEIGQAHGLAYAFDSLYVVVNGRAAQGSGLYRVRDTDGDDHYDEVKLLRKIDGGGEHGPHAVLPTPDGESLIVLGGNHTRIPNPEESRVPRNWGEDLLLPRLWDANGHARGVLAPGGWVCRTDPDGKSWELICNGFRNQFDAAFDLGGELFTFDADMEWDIGTPWYRPTRVCHIVSGAEFGWRSGTGKWPVYYPDSLPAVVNVGPGSPTGVVFGTGAKFPEKYQKAFFICDWSFGKLYAMHMTPDGASYSGEVETFATASPLPLTDLIVNPADGALYFAIGGRNTQSGLYRITYPDYRPSPAVRSAPPTPERAARLQLEALHRPDPQAVSKAWPFLGHPDRFVRFAARIAIEHQPVSEWRERALQERNPAASLTALLALVRQGDSSLQEPLLESLGRLEPEQLNEAQKLEALRVLSLAMIRMGRPNEEARQRIIATLDPAYPFESDLVNRELARILAYLEAPEAAPKTVRLLTQAGSQQEQLHYAFVLRTVKTDWTPELHRTYFSWFNQAQQYKGGASFKGFIRNIRNDALAHLDDAQKQALAGVLEGKQTDLVAPIYDPTRQFVKEYKTGELVAALEGALTGRSFERGKKMFSTAGCFACHHFAGEGGSIGPDLTGVAGRFNLHDLIESIAEPHTAISDQYQNTIFILKNGDPVVGRVANLHGDRLMVMTDMMAPGDFTNIQRNQVESIRPSTISPMPDGLINVLTLDEIKDLIAYLRSGGDRNDKAFQATEKKRADQ